MAFGVVLNAQVGGPAKSQLVHEVDALGGEIGKMADRCYLQKRVLNASKVGVRGEINRIFVGVAGSGNARHEWHVLTRGVALIGGCCTQGPAVWALRAQTDKLEYAKEMRTVLENTPNLSIREVRRHTTPSQLGSGCKGSAHSWRRFGAPSVCTTAHTADTVAPCCRINNCPSLSPGMRRQW